MRRLLAHPRQYLRRPAPRELLDRAHVEVAVVEVTFQRRHQAVQEAAVLADRVAAHRRLVGPDPLLQEFQRPRFGLGHRHPLLQHAPPQPRLSVLGAVPVRSEEHTSELPDLKRTPYAVFCLNKKNSYTTA